MAGDIGRGDSSKLIWSYILNFRIQLECKAKFLNCFKLEEEMIRCLYIIVCFGYNNNDQYLVRTSYTIVLFICTHKNSMSYVSLISPL